MKPNERLKHLREYLKYKQGEFAEILLMKQGSYSDIERGRPGVNISRRILAMLEEKFNVNSDWILNGEGTMFLPHTPHITDRIKDVMNHYKLNYYEFADKLGIDKVDKTRLIANLHDGKEVESEMINAICRAFPDISRKYIVSGTGNLLTKGRATITFKNDDSMLLDQLELYKKLNKAYEEQIEWYKKRLAELEETKKGDP